MEVNNEAETMIKGNHHEARAIRKRQQRLNDKWVPRETCLTLLQQLLIAYTCVLCFWVHSNLTLVTHTIQSTWVELTPVHFIQEHLHPRLDRDLYLQCTVHTVCSTKFGWTEYSKIRCMDINWATVHRLYTYTVYPLHPSQSLWDLSHSLLFNSCRNFSPSFPFAYLLPFGSSTALETLIKWRSPSIAHLVYNDIIKLCYSLF